MRAERDTQRLRLLESKIQGVAGLECLLVPFNTVMGIYTLVVQGWPTVQAAFLTPPPVSGEG